MAETTACERCERWPDGGKGNSHGCVLPLLCHLLSASHVSHQLNLPPFIASVSLCSVCCCAIPRRVPAPLQSGVEVPYQQLFALMTTLSALRMGLNCPWAADGGVALQPPKLSEHRGGSTAGGQHKCSAGNGLQKV